MDVAFYFKWGLGGRDVGVSLDLCFGGGGSVFLKLSFINLKLFFIKVIFLLSIFFSLFCGGSLLIFV